jgi:signal transduction histidine kinase
LSRDIEIDYTALSLAAPEKIHFKYRLEGHEDEWQDAGNRRQAFYTDLLPRKYHFRVIASNHNGVWNETGASLDVYVDAAYYQTNWFKAACAAAFVVLLAGLYHIRARQLNRHFNIRMEERVNERTRIARDLHDTLLQSFQGVLLKFQAATLMLAEREASARKTLEGAIGQAREAIEEGRDAVSGLRSSTLLTNDLARAVGGCGEELTAGQQGLRRADFHIQVEGASHDLAPMVRDEVCRITSEALRNAFRHADAEHIEALIRYEKRQLRITVQDDGKGIEDAVLRRGGRVGHHGLLGMRERAKLVGGRLEVWSNPDSGTKVELSIPASLAYRKAVIPDPPASEERS